VIPFMRRPEDEDARTFVRALIAVVTVVAKVVFWGALVFAALMLMIGEPLN